MKKMKKVFAMLLALAMVLGMSITAFAAPVGEGEQPLPAGTIKVIGINAGDTLQAVQIIEEANTATGWQFTAAGAAFKNALSETEGNDQDVLAGLIVYAATDKTAATEAMTKQKLNPISVEASQIQAALTSVTAYDATIVFNDYTTKVTKAGVYALKATATAATDDKAQSNVAYDPMAAYISFGYNSAGEVDAANLGYSQITAKKTDITGTKTVEEANKVVAIHDVVTYKIETTIPSVAANVTTVKYDITDTISGASYVTKATGDVNPATDLATAADDKIPVSVTVEGDTAARSYEAVATGDSANGFTLDLHDLITRDPLNQNANKKLTITYRAYVTGLKVGNSANIEVSRNDGSTLKTDDTTVDVYTGTLQIIKKGEGTTVLNNAEFVVYYEKDGTKYYATVAEHSYSAEEPYNYEVTGWSQDIPELHIKTTDVTDALKGAAVIKGFDSDVTYKFKEVVAPDGYSLNENDVTATWLANTSNSDKRGEAEMTDTKISALPETGGIGTTIFTIGGCLIMIAAAGLFFASRRKSAK